MSKIHQPPSKIGEYLQSLNNSRGLGAQVVFQTTLPENPATWKEIGAEWPPEIKKALRSQGIHSFYQHQAQAIDLIRNKCHVFMRNPQEFINRVPEATVINPHNPQILTQHLECAAAELPLKIDEPLANEKNAVKTLEQFEKSGILLRSSDNRDLYARRKTPTVM